MPKVSKVTLQFREKRQVFDVWYTDKDNFHLKEFPEEIHRKSGEYRRGHDSVQALEDHFRKVLRLYYEMMKEITPVILYSVWLGEAIRTYMEPSSYGGHYIRDYDWTKPIKDKLSKIPTAKYSVGMDFQVGVLITKKEAEFHKAEFDNEGNVIESTIENYGHRLSSSAEVQLQIPYTVETHLFLIDLQEKMKKMGQMLAEFMTDKTRLQQAIENKSNLLLTNS